ncbi:Imm53 family immunity protein [Streptomyces gilvosporeus]|uniref:Imm53 family immunity protein n=1 Tax=Streptomyces gilvosporeus TaxID=553510 RepID=UPI00193A4CAA|nr:Imm53 family immunity protein [Streptomyces gilvosporeus]
MPLDPLSSLTAWYTSQCDGGWEHEYGIRIETLDNPGWSVCRRPAEHPHVRPARLPTDRHTL